MLLKFTVQLVLSGSLHGPTFSGGPTTLFEASVATVSALPVEPVGTALAAPLSTPIAPMAAVRNSAPAPFVSCAAPVRMFGDTRPTPVVTNETATAVMDVTMMQTTTPTLTP